MKENGELMVYKSNDLIQKSKFSLSKVEIQIINYIISQIDSPLYDREFNKIQFNIKDFYNLSGVEKISGSAYQYLKNTIKTLADKSVWVNFPEEGRETLIRWIEKPEINKQSGMVTIKLDDDLKPFLLNMNGYIKAQLSYSFKMQSKYSIRLYELLKSWEKAGSKHFDVAELKTRIDADQKSYENFGIFRKKVLDVAVSEINEYTDIHVTYDEEKTGKKVTGITFRITVKDDVDINNEDPTFAIDIEDSDIFKEKDFTEYGENDVFAGMLYDMGIEITVEEAELLRAEAAKHIDPDENPAHPYILKITDYIIDKASLMKADKSVKHKFKWLLSAVKGDWK